MSRLFSRVSCLGANDGFSGWVFPNSLFVGGFPHSLIAAHAAAGHPLFLRKEKGGKDSQGLRPLTPCSTQASSVKRGLRLWKQQPKQSPPFS